MDSPTELSDNTLRSFTVRNPDGKEYTIRTAVHHDGDPSVIDEYAAGAEQIVNEAAAVFGEFPAFDTGTYTFLGDYVPWGGGDGMEHRNSTVVASPTSFKNPQAARAALGTVSHKFFHCWNVERIRPKTRASFNVYGRARPSRLSVRNWGTPAYRAGREEGDVITVADGKAIATLDDWQAAVRAHKPGDSMAVEFTRHGSAVKASIAVGEDPTMEVVTLDSTGGTLSADQKAMRDGWLGSKRK